MGWVLLHKLKSSGFGNNTNQWYTRGYYGMEDVCMQRRMLKCSIFLTTFDEVYAPEDRFVVDGLRKPSPKFELEMISRYERPDQCWMEEQMAGRGDRSERGNESGFSSNR